MSIELNNLLSMPISTLMQHRINMSEIFKHKVYELQNYSDKINFFLTSIESEYDLFRGAESLNTVSFYAPVISYPGQTVVNIFSVAKNGNRSLIDVMKFDKKDTSQQIKLYINQDSPEDHDLAYSDSQVYYDRVKSQWSGFLTSLGDMKRRSKTKTELSQYYSCAAEISSIIGYDLILSDGKYSENDIVKGSHNLDLTFVSLLWAHFNLHKKVDWNEIILLFESFKKHLKDVETYFKQDSIDVEYYFEHIAKIIIVDGEGF